MWHFRDLLIASAIGLLGSMCFSSSINGRFVFDDAEAIVNNKDILLDSPIYKLFEDDFWGVKISHNSSHKSYRPLTVLSFRFNVWLNNGALNPRSFHIFNLFLHGIATSLCYPLSWVLFKRSKTNDFKPFLATLLFAVHPVHSEAVAGIVGRADLLCAIFSFLSVLIYYVGTKNVKPLKVVFITIVASLCSGLAMLSKEQGITALGVCGAFDILIINNINPKDIIKGIFYTIKDYKIHKTTIKIYLYRYYLMFLRLTVLTISGCLFLYFRFWIMDFKGPYFHKTDNPASFADGIFTRFINFNYIYVINLWILLCPEWLCFDWSMGCIPLINVKNIFVDPRILAVIFLWIVFGLLILKQINLPTNPLSQNVFMALSVLLIPFSVASNLFFRVGFVIAERVLYIPSLGFCMLVAIGFDLLFPRFQRKYIIYLTLALLIIINITRCNLRSFDWRSEKHLFESGLKVCPLNAKVHYNLAKTSHNVSNAIKHYREALRLHPDYEQALNNLANVLRDNGDLNEAESLLRKAIEIRPNFAAAWMNLGIVLSHLNRYDEALQSYNTALIHRKKYPDCYYNLGNLFLSKQKYNEAYAAWMQATNQKPTHTIAWNNLIVMMDSLGDLDKAEDLAKEALKILPDDSALHFNLANTLGKKGQYQSAEIHFKTAIKLRPNQSLYHTNLGVLYHRWKKYVLAEEQYLIALRINPTLKNVEQNLKSVQKLIAKLNYVN
ncbi:hypothetical protein O3M35_010520 [Rhynocoris fuscipes]|uniref:dolichyl-phosphate-mannose--protein mannosyltransferase n=1 Tax=Rhynocoris fuscipes TaxID=488301 RepID=A0AAW1CZ76_9HEMI